MFHVRFMLLGLLVSVAPASAILAAESTEQWGTFEAAFEGPKDGNPFTEVEFTATFRQGSKSVPVAGFYDGDGIYRIRFMPPTLGDWTYTTKSNRGPLDGKSGSLTVITPSVGNHGPVQVHNRTQFAYADGTSYREIGTTCYVWNHQPAALQSQTLKTLAASPFNKLRMCVFPKWYLYNRAEPLQYPFMGKAPKQWEFARFNPAFFRQLEQQISKLRDLGIEADLILFHPYDGGHWGFDRMTAEQNDRYVKYLVARLAAYRNVWWSLANEWDLVKAKSEADWDRIGQLIQSQDPYGHLCSLHNCRKIYDPTRSWISHISLQSSVPEDAGKLIQQYGKPLIYDECCYEGNIERNWGNITPERMTAMFWKTMVSGAYCGHGETYMHPKEILWWSHGGELHGQSPARIAFFKTVFDAAPSNAKPLAENAWGIAGEYYLFYLWERQPAILAVTLPKNVRFKAEVIDTYAMTITLLPDAVAGKATIPLPSKPYQAVRLTVIRPK